MKALVDHNLEAPAVLEAAVDQNLALRAIGVFGVWKICPAVCVAAEAGEADEPAQAGEREMVVFRHLLSVGR